MPQFPHEIWLWCHRYCSHNAGDIQNHGWYLQRCIPPTLQSKRCLFPSARQGGNSIFICKLEINQNTGVFALFHTEEASGVNQPN